MQFIHQPLTWGFFLVLVPLLIHLINLMRHRRVKWAAMDFLLQSYKKHRRWIWLRQLLLLLLRMLAVAAVVAMLARLVTQGQGLSFFGSRTTHHYVLLDDSYSMSDRAGDTTAFDLARQAISRLSSRAMEQGSPQKLTLIRYSQAAMSTDPGYAAQPQETANGARKPDVSDQPQSSPADLNAEPLNSSFEALLAEKGQAFAVSHLASGPEDAVELTEKLLQASPDEQSVVYLVSDFRRRHWEASPGLRTALQRLNNLGADLHLIRCVDQQHRNLALIELIPSHGTLAAGVPFFVKFTVKNFGQQPVDNVTVKVRPIEASKITRSGIPEGQLQGPDVLIERIEAGASVTRQVQVFFATAGQHVVMAELPFDSVPADNQRWHVVDLPVAVPVLVIDSGDETAGAYYLTSAFQPGQRATTGIQTSIKPATFLRDVTSEALDEYRSIYLLNTGSMDERAVNNLRTFVRSGGGLGWFLGPNSNIAFLNELHAEGRGLFPIPLRRMRDLDMDPDVPDVQFADHPIFRVLLGDRNPFASSIRIQQFVGAPRGWEPPDDSTINLLATLRDNSPLVAEKSYGDGRVVAFMTTASPTWNNWALEPSFIVSALETQAYLTSFVRSEAPRLAGSPINLEFNADLYRGDVTFSVPAHQISGSRVVLTKNGTPKDEGTYRTMSVSLGKGNDGLRNGETDRTGVYEARRQTVDGQTEVQRFALNVDSEEGELALLDARQLTEQLQPVRANIHEADQLVFSSAAQAGFPWSRAIMFGLIGLLLLEQLLAYSSSYHISRGPSA